MRFPSKTSRALLAVALLPWTAACGGSSPEPRSETSVETTPPEPGSVPPADDPAPAPPAAAPEASGPAADPGAEAPLGEGDSRTMESIAALVKTHRPEARACYEAGRKQIEGLKGDLVVHFILKPSGEVKLAELNKERSTLSEPSVVRCVVGVITKIQFPKSSKGLETTVNYPFNFTP